MTHSPGLRQAIRRIPFARRIYERAYRQQLITLQMLPAFAPFSAGGLVASTRLTLLAANQTPGLLVQLMDSTGHRPLVAISPDDFCRTFGGEATVGELGALFGMHGSDKSTRHDYHPVYAGVLADLGSASGILEVGLGTNHTDVPSNMGPLGRPGASLRAFRDFLPECRIYGADIDARILFEEERIATFQVDQTDQGSLDTLAGQLPPSLDLVIDDGLHSPNANLGVLLLGLAKVRPGGWVVIEDIPRAALPIWRVAELILRDGHDCHLIESRAAFLFCVRRQHAVQAQTAS